MKKYIDLELGKALANRFSSANSNVTIDRYEDGEWNIDLHFPVKAAKFFTENPLCEEGDLYVRWNQSFEDRFLMNGCYYDVYIQESGWDLITSGIEPEDIDKVSDYFDMVLTKDGEWCFAPLFKEASEKGSLKYATLEYEAVENRLLQQAV